MSRTEVSIRTPDAATRALTFRPEGQDAWPAVIFFTRGNSEAEE